MGWFLPWDGWEWDFPLAVGAGWAAEGQREEPWGGGAVLGLGAGAALVWRPMGWRWLSHCRDAGPFCSTFCTAGAGCSPSEPPAAHLSCQGQDTSVPAALLCWQCLLWALLCCPPQQQQDFLQINSSEPQGRISLLTGWISLLQYPASPKDGTVGHCSTQR